MAVRGKVVIVTGGAKGIGRYIARTFASEGARLAIADIAPMDTVAGEVEGLGAEAPAEARKRMKGVEAVGNRYILAAEAPMELSGHHLVVENGKLAIAPD